MMQLDYRLVAVLYAMAIVFVLSVLGSFIVWINESGFGNQEGSDPASQRNRWKWMMILFLLLTTAQLLSYRN